MKVEKAREIRLWLVQVVAPLTLGGVIVWNNCPNLRYAVTDKYSKAKNKVKQLIKGRS